MISYWQRIPLLMRAIIVGLLVEGSGVYAWLVIYSLLPAPWSIIVMGGVLWLYWKYFSGGWWPKYTAETRREMFRAVSMPATIWKWSLLAATFFVVIVQAGFVLTFRIIKFPAEQFTEGYAYDGMPIWLAWLGILMASLVAGICEETGFRGYMQVPLEKRYGSRTGIAIVSTMFVVVHLSQAWAPPLLLHLFAMSVLLGMLAYTTGSLIVSMIGHTVMDIFNFSYWWTDIGGRFEYPVISETGLDYHFFTWLLVFAGALALFFLCIRKIKAIRQQA